MPRINGGTVGKANRPTYTSALGTWGVGDIENSRRTGSWPLALSTISVVISHSTTPFVAAYPWSSAGFGSKYANPTTLPASTGNGVAFDPSGGSVVIAHATSPFVSAYPWSSAGFGSKYANPAILPGGTGTSVAFTAVSV